ncbi:chemotaxis protein CheC [Natronolimnobius baerhuensis]|uniref:Chemotaxis protein CheC n=1 Tax=Natronolimnobius baerhuensis TaxID=253108 RepID=A0A202EBL6_9EURY|nr:chemotaxis protein CheC [Natronolimnobius baerhuensis]OVE85625.1 chemotaxis protein CheC [Natronolimnobius baerhuensis]
MKLDVNALGTFYRMAREGAGLAAGRLTHMTDVETRVGVTKLNFMRGHELRHDFEDSGEKVGVRVELTGAIEGYSVIVFDRANALRIVETLVEESDAEEFDEMNRSAVTEVGQIMNNGFIDGWADVLETVIDVSTPEFIKGESAEPFIGDIETASGDELALLFQSQIEAVGTEVGFSHYLFPKRDSMADLLDQLRASNGIEYDKLDGFDRMAERGAEEIAKTATTLTGIETSVDIRRLNFVSLESIPQQVPNEKLVGVAFEFEGTPSGFLLFLFDEQSADEIIDAMVPAGTPVGDDDTDGYDEMGRSAITELGNIMASGFLDGWANVLDTTIDHSTPEFIHDIGAAAVDPVVIRLGESQEFAFVFDTVITADGREFDCEVYAIPDEDDLERALNDLDVERIEETPTTADFQQVNNT